MIDSSHTHICSNKTHSVPKSTPASELRCLTSPAVQPSIPIGHRPLGYQAPSVHGQARLPSLRPPAPVPRAVKFHIIREGETRKGGGTTARAGRGEMREKRNSRRGSPS